MSEQQIPLFEETAGPTDLQLLMSKAADEITDADVAEMVRILRERRNLYAIEEAEKAAKPKREAKPKAAPKAKTVTPAKPKKETDAIADSLSGGLDLGDLGDLGL